jgi:hypothetical protein
MPTVSRVLDHLAALVPVAWGMAVLWELLPGGTSLVGTGWLVIAGGTLAAVAVIAALRAAAAATARVERQRGHSPFGVAG